MSNDTARTQRGTVWLTRSRAVPAPAGGCWEITGCSSSPGASVGCGYGCKSLPKPGSNPSKCALNGAWSFNSNGTVTSVMDGHCLELSGGKGTAVTVGPCTGSPNQLFKAVPSTTVAGAITVQQNGLCVDNGYASGLPQAQHRVAAPQPPVVRNRTRSVWIPPGEWTSAFGAGTVTGQLPSHTHARGVFSLHLASLARWLSVSPSRPLASLRCPTLCEGGW